jgi:hypothetical protein
LYPLATMWLHHWLKEKFLVNFQGVQANVSTEEDFYSCQQYERETLPDLSINSFG